MSAYTVPMFLRGEVITDDLVPFDTRSGARNSTRRTRLKHVHRLPLSKPGRAWPTCTRCVSTKSSMS